MATAISQAPRRSLLRGADLGNLARHNLGFSHVITILVRYPISQLPTLEELCVRADQLQSRFNASHCRLEEGEDGTGWYWREATRWDPKQIVKSFSSETGRSEDLIVSEIKRMQEEDIFDSPTWQVVRYEGPRGSGVGHLTVSVNHLLCDGRGAFNIFDKLVRPQMNDTQTEDFFNAIQLGDTPLKLDTTTPVASNPNQPWKAEAGNLPLWPNNGNVVKQSAIDGESSWVFAFLKEEIVKTLKLRAKSNGLPSVTPALLAAYILALKDIIPRDLPLAYTINTAIAVDYRDTSKGHAQLTSSYHRAIVKVVQREDLDNCDFWALAKEIASVLYDQGQRTKTLQQISAPSSGTSLADLSRNLFSQPSAKDGQYATSLAFSNMTFQSLPANAENMFWSQSASPIIRAPLVMQLLGCEAGLNANVIYRRGSVVDDREMEQLIRSWEDRLVKVAWNDSL